jgi:hypothetical protein
MIERQLQLLLARRWLALLGSDDVIVAEMELSTIFNV